MTKTFHLHGWLLVTYIEGKYNGQYKLPLTLHVTYKLLS